MRVSVKKSHINQGIPRDAGCCPVALALKDCFFQKEIAVGLNVMYIGGKEYRITDKIAAFIETFDGASRTKRGQLKPFKFVLKR